jgi:hypothetical protein
MSWTGYHQDKILWRVRVAPLINAGSLIAYIDLLDPLLTFVTALSYHT